MAKPYLIDFRQPETASQVAVYAGIDDDTFNRVISSNSRSEFYFEHKIPKRSPRRSNKFRTVWESRDVALSEAHKTVARRFEHFARLADPEFPHEAAYGYVRHRSTRDNAAIHCGAPLLLRADIQNYFPSISIGRLITRFVGLGMYKEAAEALAKFVTIDDALAIGLNSSPMLANLVSLELDKKLQKLAGSLACRYSRYADDIAISSKSHLPKREELEALLAEEGFQLSAEKFRVTKLGQAHYVTGLSISDTKSPHVPRRMKRRLRQELHYCRKFGIFGHLTRIGEQTLQQGVNRLDGTVRYVSYVEARNSIKSKWNDLTERDGVEASYHPPSPREARIVTCYVDETEIVFGNRRFLALGLVFTEDPNALATSTVATLRAHQKDDPFYAGNRDDLAKRGLHFTDSHPDLRTAYLKVLAGLPYRAFVIFGEMKDIAEYQQKYVSLLRTVLPRRMIWYDGAVVLFVFEENSKVDTELLRQVVKESYETLTRIGNRRPLREPDVVCAKKLAHPSFAVPDYLLAVFARFAQFSQHGTEQVRLHQFERLRDKYRLIIDADAGTEFSRRHPFSPWPG